MSNRLFASWQSRLPAWWVDALVTLAPAAVLVGARALEARGEHRVGWLGYALTVLAALVVVERRRAPLLVFALALALSVTVVAVAAPSGAISLTVLVAVYTLAQVQERRRALLLAVLAGVVLALARGLLQYRGWSDARTALEPALALATLFLGWAVRSRRAYIAEIEARVAQAERARAEEAARQVDAERLRIARELHDVLAHGIATINVQAGVAAHVLEDRPEYAAQALRTIKATSKEALRELRDILGVLREAGELEPREPARGLGQLDRLIDTTIQAGLPTRVSVRGERRALPATVDLAAYRILQESLTNALRHGGGSGALVRISYAADVMTISVDDEGCDEHGARPTAKGAASRTPGHGILGMRERAHALGGELQAGPRPGGGFRVCARLPIAAGS